MISILIGICLGISLGWFSYAHRRLLIALVIATVAAGHIVLIFVILPLFKRASLSYEISDWELVKRMYDGLVPEFLQDAVPWLFIFTILAHVVTAIAYKGFEPEPAIEESREDKRRRVRAEMKYSDHYFD